MSLIARSTTLAFLRTWFRMTSGDMKRLSMPSVAPAANNSPRGAGRARKGNNGKRRGGPIARQQLFRTPAELGRRVRTFGRRAVEITNQ